MIRLVNVSKRYANGHEALHRLNLVMDKGEMAFLTGHSGAGKTTLLKLISLIERPTSGQVWLNNKNVTQCPNSKIPYYRRNIGIVFQNPHLLPNRTVFDNVALPLIIHGMRHQEIRKRVSAALSKVSLSGKERLYPEALSGGEQQRVGIARAVVNKPPLLLADEPTGNLDPQLSLEIMQLFALFNQVGVTILIATHDVMLLQRLPQRIITLDHGNVIAAASEVQHA
jgi:cell division transport system ATP-binding protein